MIHLLVFTAATGWYQQPSGGLSTQQTASGESSVTIPVIVTTPSTAPASSVQPVSDVQWIAGATAGAAIVWLFLRRFARRPMSVVSSANRRPAGPSESDFDWLKEHDSSP